MDTNILMDLLEAERVHPEGLPFNLFAVIALGNSCCVRALRFDHARIDGVDADLAWTQLFGERLRYGIDRRFGGTIDRAVRGREGADDRTNITTYLPLLAFLAVFNVCA